MKLEGIDEAIAALDREAMNATIPVGLARAARATAEAMRAIDTAFLQLVSVNAVNEERRLRQQADSNVVTLRAELEAKKKELREVREELGARVRVGLRIFAGMRRVGDILNRWRFDASTEYVELQQVVNRAIGNATLHDELLNAPPLEGERSGVSFEQMVERAAREHRAWGNSLTPLVPVSALAAARAECERLKRIEAGYYESLKEFDNYGSGDVSVCIREVLTIVRTDMPHALRTERERAEKAEATVARLTRERDEARESVRDLLFTSNEGQRIDTASLYDLTFATRVGSLDRMICESNNPGSHKFERQIIQSLWDDCKAHAKARRDELAKDDAALRARLATVENALRPLAAIADAYDDDGLDEARPYWVASGVKPYNPDVELYCGRGGEQLLVLRHALDARAALAPAAAGSGAAGEKETGR